MHLCKDGNMRIAAEILTAAEVKSNGFFSGLTNKEISELLGACTMHVFEPGEFGLNVLGHS